MRQEIRRSEGVIQDDVSSSYRHRRSGIGLTRQFVYSYFGAYPDATLHAFWSDFAQWQRKLLVADLVAAGVAPDSSSVSSLTLADLPLPLFYRVFCTPSALDASAVRTLVLSMLPSKPRSTTPYPPPVYLIYAIVDEDDELRNWALEQLRLYPKRSIKNGDFVGPYYNAVRVILEALDGSFPPDTHIKVDTTILWRALSDLLPQLPLQAPEHRKTALEIRDTVRSHLPDDTSREYLSTAVFQEYLQTDQNFPSCSAASRLSFDISTPHSGREKIPASHMSFLPP
jgi:hypothetical protein